MILNKQHNNILINMVKVGTFMNIHLLDMQINNKKMILKIVLNHIIMMDHVNNILMIILMKINKINILIIFV